MRTKLAAALIAVLITFESAQASTTWTGAGDGIRWDDPLNWSAGLPMAGGDSSARTFVDGVGTTILIDAQTAATTSRLLLADAPESDNITINMTGGTLTSAASTTGEQNWHLGSQGTATFNMTGGVVLLTGQVRFGVDAVPTAQGILTINGGEFTATGPLIMGFNAASTEVQHLNMLSGSLTASRLFVNDDIPSAGEPMAIVNMTGGSITVGDLAIPTNWGRDGLNGHFQLDGGTVTVTNLSTGGQQNQPAGFRLANGPGADTQSGNTVTGTMDITFGTLKLTGDALPLIETYITTDKSLLAYGGTGIVVRDLTTNPGFTTVSALVLGDANRDGVVNIFDINLISSNWNTTGPTADVNGDHVVNIFDVNAVSAHWLQTNPDGPTAGIVAANAVPEPATLVSLAIGAMLFGTGFLRLRTMH